MVEIKCFLLCLLVELREAIRKEAERKGISSNSLVVTILWEYFKPSRAERSNKKEMT